MGKKKRILAGMLVFIVIVLLTSVLLAVTGWSPPGDHASSYPVSTQPEAPVIDIPLGGEVRKPKAELSGLAWYGDWLILLPQYPIRFGSGDGALFGLRKKDILDYLGGKSKAALTPVEIPLYSGGFEHDIPGFEGYEGIAIQDDWVFLTIESHHWLTMIGYVVSGSIAPDLSSITLDPKSLVENKPQMNLFNKTDEALLISDDTVLTFYEANGALNPDPHATRFDLSLRPQGRLPFPHIEYRLTDVTPIDKQGRFWAIDAYYKGERSLRVDYDPLSMTYGQGKTHSQSEIVERLIELQYNPDGIKLAGTPPIQLQLLGPKTPRNWEGVARLDQSGFLMVTDEWPRTILGFIAYP